MILSGFYYKSAKIKYIFFLKVGILRRFGEYWHSSLSGFKDTFIKISDSQTRMDFGRVSGNTNAVLGLKGF